MVKMVTAVIAAIMIEIDITITVILSMNTIP